MDPTDVARWFDEYLATFVAVCRGDRNDPEVMLGYYSVPMLMTGDAGASWLLDAGQVLDVVRGQAATLQADGYGVSDVADPRTVVLNAACARHEADFVRRRTDGSEIARFTASYVIVDLPGGRRITTVSLHG